ncbi:MAG: hypothetical protein Q9173_002436 [Seirophora scorigena]
MAGLRDIASAEYVPLHSRAPSPSGSNWTQSGKQLPVHEAPPTVNPKNLNYRKQTWSLLVPQTFRWLGTVLGSGLLVPVIHIYGQKGDFTPHDKNVFNVIVTGLSVGLGINFFVRLTIVTGSAGLKESAKGLRWRILADKRLNVRKVDLVLAIESLWKTAQISISLITLTFDMVDGRSFNDTYTSLGRVNAPYLACYASRNPEHPFSCPGNATVHSKAHLYGERADGLPCGHYATIDEVVKSPHDLPYFCSDSAPNPQFAYRFKEYNPAELARAYPLFTNRTITASAGDCLVYYVKNETHVPNVDGQGPGSNFTYGDGSSTGGITIPASSLGLSGTTYMYKGVQAPQHTEHRCGPRCMWLWAYKNVAGGTINEEDPPALYRCPVTRDTQVLPVEVARIAAVSIALQGRWSGPDEEHANFNQYLFYPYGTPWEIHWHNATHVGANMAKFAIGSIAQMAAANPPIQVSGSVPKLGSHLEIRWGYAAALFAGIIVTHLVLFLSAILATRKIAIKDDSFLAIARLLLPLFHVLDNKRGDFARWQGVGGSDPIETWPR